MRSLWLSPAALFRFLAYSSAILIAAAPSLRAQDPTPPAYVAIVEGGATLEHEGQAEAAVVNMPVVPGDRLLTGAGRAEVLFADGTALDIDENTSLTLETETVVRLDEGRVILDVSANGAQTRYEIGTPAGVTETDRAGQYRVWYPERYAAVRFDAFDRWSRDLHDARTTSSSAPSAQYLPPNLQMYGSTFDQYGSWSYSAPYGYVWYPTVAPGWRPYYRGYWAPYRPYGWTWIGIDRWAWPTHHYGRWGFARGAWFWIPARTWAPAWVSWGAAPDFVSWCPLGFDNRPVFALSVGYGNPWAGWVVLPRHNFGARGYYANRFAVAPHLIPRATPFIVQDRPPVGVSVAARRAGRVDGAAAQFAVPRGGVAVPRTSEIVPRANDGRPIDRSEATTAADRRTGFHSRRPENDYQVPTAQPRRPAAEYRPPAADYRIPTRDYRTPASDYRPPATDYRAVPRWGTPTRVEPPRRLTPGPAAPQAPYAPSMQAVPRWEARPRVEPIRPMTAAPAAVPSFAPTERSGYVAVPRGMAAPAPSSSAPRATAPAPPTMRSAPASAAPASDGRAPSRHPR